MTTTVDPDAVSRAVIDATSEVAGRDVTELTPLFRAVDPDALDALLAPRSVERSGGPLGITFTYGGCRVTVERVDDGTASVTVVRNADE